MMRTPSSLSALCMAARTIARSVRNPPHVSSVPNRQFLVKGMEEAMILNLTCGVEAGMGEDMKVRRSESCWGPRIVAFGIPDCSGWVR